MPFPSRFIRPLNAVLFATAVVVVSVPQAYAKIYPQAKKLAPQLRPQGLTARPDPNGLKKAQDQAIKILNAMEDNAATGGPDPRGLLTMAFEFQPGVGPVHQTALAGTLMQMWTEARGLGLFDENHKFTPTITRGADTGKNVVFEYIVPLSVLPDFSRDIANLRLIAPSRAGRQTIRSLNAIRPTRHN